MVRTQSSPAPKRQNGARNTAPSTKGPSGPAATAVRTFAHQQHPNGPASHKSTAPTHPPPHSSNSVSASTKPSSKSRPNSHLQPSTHASQAPVTPPLSRTQRPVTESADTAFDSGAWLFDASRMPAWLAQQLQPTAGRSNSTPVKAAVVKGSQKAGKSPRTARQAPGHEAQVIRVGSRPVREQPADIGFESGAWLFDETQQPDWLTCELRAASTSTSTSGRKSRSQQQKRAANTASIDPPVAPPSPKQRSSHHASIIQQAKPAPVNPLAMSWAQVAASPPTSPNRTFTARPPTKHRDPPPASKRASSVPQRRIPRNPHHLVRPAPTTTTAASTAQALDLPPATHTHDNDASDADSPGAYTLFSSNPTYPLSLHAAHARMHVLHYAHRAASGDCGPVAWTSPAAERVRESLYRHAARALSALVILCLVLSVSLAGLVAHTGRPLVPAQVGSRWMAHGTGTGVSLVVGMRGTRERLRMQQQMAKSRNPWVVEAEEDGLQGKVIYA